MKQLVYSTILTKEVADYSTGVSRIPYTRLYSQLPADFLFLQETDIAQWRFKIERDLTERARVTIGSASNDAVAALATEVLDSLRSAFNGLSSTEDLPYIDAFEGSDGSIVLEWIFTHMRIGFSIEKDLEESAWYLVTDSASGAIQASGNLMNEDLKWLVNWLACAVP